MKPRRHNVRGLGAELAELERTSPAVAVAARELDRVTHRIGVGGMPGGPVTTRSPADRSMWRAKNTADVERALAAKARREAEAIAWIAEVKARKAGRQ